MKSLLYPEDPNVDESELADVADAAMKYQLPPSFFQDMAPLKQSPGMQRNLPLMSKPKTLQQNFALGDSGASHSVLVNN
jgi:hypothetical protein